jgi:hypothetical protein
MDKGSNGKRRAFYEGYMKKKHAFWAGLISLMGIFLLTLFVNPDSLAAIGPAVVAGIVGACGFYQGTNVADNWQRSKYYRPELDGKGE